MEVQFNHTEVPYLEAVVRDTRSQELTQEIRLPEGMPDMARVLCAWGQTVLRGKEWNSGSIRVTGGLMVWVLYEPEEGNPQQCMEGWIPFQIRWDLPEDCPDGTLGVRLLTRFVDARAVTPRKLMVRGGIGCQAEALVSRCREVAEPGGIPDQIQLKQTARPVQLLSEAGEKVFELDEELSLSGPEPDKILYCRMEPRVSEKRVVGNKLVFRGVGDLHLLYRCREGKLYSRDLELPFSQLTELDREYGPEARAEVVLVPTVLEPELTEMGGLRFHGSLAGQYTITDRQLLTLGEDAYSPDYRLETRMEETELPTVLENRRETLYGEQRLQAEAEDVEDVVCLPDLPKVARTDAGLEITAPMQLQVLYRDREGRHQVAGGRWEGTVSLPAGEETELWIMPASAEAPRASASGGQLVVNCSLPLEMTAHTRERMPMLTAVSTGEPVIRPTERPSLILHRAGDQSLWELAKAAGTTMEAIRRANGLTEEPAPGRMLLIPVP